MEIQGQRVIRYQDIGYTVKFTFTRNGLRLVWRIVLEQSKLCAKRPKSLLGREIAVHNTKVVFLL